MLSWRKSPRDPKAVSSKILYKVKNSVLRYLSWRDRQQGRSREGRVAERRGLRACHIKVGGPLGKKGSALGGRAPLGLGGVGKLPDNECSRPRFSRKRSSKTRAFGGDGRKLRGKQGGRWEMRRNLSCLQGSGDGRQHPGLGQRVAQAREGESQDLLGPVVEEPEDFRDHL